MSQALWHLNTHPDPWAQVNFYYEFKGGRYCLDSKCLEVTTTGRYQVNEQLNNLLE